MIGEISQLVKDFSKISVMIDRTPFSGLVNKLVSFKTVHLMMYWLWKVYIFSSIRSCQFSQGLPAIALAQARRAGDIYRLGRT